MTGDAHNVSGLSNHDLLAALDEVLVEVERRLLHFAHRGPEILEMADEGLVLATRTAARLRQAQSAATHAAGHLQIVGVGEWRPRSINPGWSDDERITRDTGEPHN
jgi:hypothetical protein